MSTRLAQNGRLIDSRQVLGFTFNGSPYSGLAGDTVASALLASNQRIVGRSFKFHRPRGIMASGPEEPNALVSLGTGAQHEPNCLATMVELENGLTVTSQNHWPSLEWDLGGASDVLSRFLPAGFYYKTFISPAGGWEKLFEPLIRRMAGLGKAPEHGDRESYEHFHTHVDLLIIGGGIAGLLAARIAARSGCRILVIEQQPYWGGRSPVDGVTVDGGAAGEWIDDAVSALSAQPHVTMRLRTTGVGSYGHGYFVAHERPSTDAGTTGPRGRLWKIRARKTILATGAIERPLTFPGNDVPGVMLASGARDYIADFAVSPGDRTVLVTNGDDGYRTAIAIRQAGLEVPAILDTRMGAGGSLPARARDLGIRILEGKGVASVRGHSQVRRIAVCACAGEGAILEEIACESVAVSGGWSPAVHLWSHMNGKLKWNPGNQFFQPDQARPPVGDDGKPMIYPAGAANGVLAAEKIADDVAQSTSMALRDLGLGSPADHECMLATGEHEEPPAASWLIPNGMSESMKRKAFVDFQNDVKVADIELAAREGYESVEHTKRYTTLGMATDQGKTSNVNGLAILASCVNAEIPDVGTTTFRPPYTPISMGSIAGEAAGELFKPVRQTPMHGWHETHGAHWEPVGDWRRPYCYRLEGESVEEAVSREVRRTRQGAGLLDASTLGKILVKGPDACRLVDMLYTGLMSSLPVGRCRYGLMCNENGFLMDDGVVARLGKDSFLCHTTTGGADRIHGWIEEWLQTEWWNWKVYVINLTEQFAQIGLAGPKSRAILEGLGASELSAKELPFMHWRDIELAGIPARIFRISFSGELSFEIAVRAGEGMTMWTRLLEAGRAYDVVPYGTECLHVMRAEKGFIMIGDETDGTVTPQDLNLHWAISGKKEDYLGKRAQERTFLKNPDRWTLAGLATLDEKVVLPTGCHAAEPGKNAHGHRRMIGRVTSSYFSPTLERSIALGLVANSQERQGSVLEFPTGEGNTIRARVVDPVFLDREGTRQNA